jgi:hypothetical protein
MKNLRYILLILIAILCISSFSISLGSEIEILGKEYIEKSSIKMPTE